MSGNTQCAFVFSLRNVYTHVRASCHAPNVSELARFVLRFQGRVN